MTKFLAVLSVGLIIVNLILLGRHTVSTENSKPYVLVVPAHIGEEQYPGYVKIYEDVTKDLAIYYDTEYSPNVIPVDSYVESADGRIHGYVSEVDDHSFYFKLDEEARIMKGDSGTPMYCNDAYVGFVSSITLDDRVLVVCY